jgi:subtilisin family serine protease
MLPNHRNPRRVQINWLVAGLALAIALLHLTDAVAQDEDESPWAENATSSLFLPMAQSGPAAQSGGDVIPDQYIVVLKDPGVRAAGGEVETAAAFADRVVPVAGGEVLGSFDAVMPAFVARLSPAALAQVQADPGVDYVEPDRVILVDATQANATWGLDRIDQLNRPLNTSYTYNVTGSGVHAYIIDTGIRTTHAQFAGRIGNGYTAVTDGQGTNDCNGHGTHVAGTVGGATFGVAKAVTLHAVRVLGCTGSGSTSGVIAGINWVAQNRVLPAVANMSLGGSASTSLDTAVRSAISRGVVFILAAGNANVDACSTSPARTVEAITVGASDSSDNRASFSNYGTCLDLFAPGVIIQSAMNSSDTASGSMSGTSMAAPHVTGAAALYLSAYRTASPAAVAAALAANAGQNKVVNAGAGSPNRLLYIGFIPAGGGSVSPTATPTRTPVPAVTPTPAPVAGCTNLVKNGNFDAGRVNWTEASVKGFKLICSAGTCSGVAAPRSGAYLSWLGGSDSEQSEIRQQVAIPAGKKATLIYYSRTSSNDYCFYDFGYMRVIDGTLVRTVKRHDLCTTNSTNGYVRTQLDLSSYAGKTVTLSFRAVTDSSLVSSLFIDDVALWSGDSCATASAAMAAPLDEAGVEAAADMPGEDVAPSAAPKPQVAAGAEAAGR